MTPCSVSPRIVAPRDYSANPDAAQAAGIRHRIRSNDKLVMLISYILQPEELARLGGRSDDVAELLDDMRGLLDQRGVARRELALGEIEIVLEPDPHVAAQQHGLRHHRELMQ